MIRVFILSSMVLGSIIAGAGRPQGQQRQVATLNGQAKSSATPPQTSSPTGGNGQRGDEDEVIRVDTNLVSIPVSVLDHDGRYITDLRKEDFQIFEDGVEQQVPFFAPVEQPFTILFLLDMSGSMGYRLADLASATNAFVKQLRPDDRLSVVLFADFPWVLLHTTRVSDLRENIKLRQRTDQHGTMIYDAVDDAFKRMKKISGRKALVLFSDGYGSGNSSAKDNLRKAEEQDALIYTVQFNTLPSKPPRYLNQKEYFKEIEEGNRYMKDLAQKSGGRYYLIDTLPDIEKTFGFVADELRRQYSLGYYPKNLKAGQHRQIKVKMRLPNLVVLARDSYTVAKAAPRESDG